MNFNLPFYLDFPILIILINHHRQKPFVLTSTWFFSHIKYYEYR